MKLLPCFGFHIGAANDRKLIDLSKYAHLEKWNMSHFGVIHYESQTCENNFCPEDQ